MATGHGRVLTSTSSTMLARLAAAQTLGVQCGGRLPGALKALKSTLRRGQSEGSPLNEANKEALGSWKLWVTQQPHKSVYASSHVAMFSA